MLFERSEFLIDTGTSPPKNPSVRVCVRLTLVFVWKKIVLVLVWGTSERLVPAKKKQNTWYQRALRCQLRGRPFHPWAGQLRFSGEAHPGPATLTQSSVFSFIRAKRVSNIYIPPKKVCVCSTTSLLICLLLMLMLLYSWQP